jgi:FkbM family methyltransferase
MKQAFKKIIDGLGIDMALKKNLWYKDAWRVQQRLMAGKTRPVIFDVGACDGGTVKSYKELFPDAIVHGFEPQPIPFGKMSSVAQSFKDVYANNLALSDRKGTTEFFITAGYASSSLLPGAVSNTFVDSHTLPQEKITVQLDTLDDFTAEHGIDRIDLLKMDVQGGELAALKGATRLLKENRIGIIYTEIWFMGAYKDQPYYEDIALFVREYGFRVLGLYDIHIDINKNGQNLWGDAIFIKDGN